MDQADATANRNVADRQGVGYSDYSSYPLDQGIIGLPQRNAEALARQNADAAMNQRGSRYWMSR